MAYNEKLTNRIREALADIPNVEEKKIKKDFNYSIGLALDFNKRAKAAPKRKKNGN